MEEYNLHLPYPQLFGCSTAVDTLSIHRSRNLGPRLHYRCVVGDEQFQFLNLNYLNPTFGTALITVATAMLVTIALS